MRLRNIFFFVFCMPMFVALAQPSKDTFEAKRDNFWLNVWLNERRPSMLLPDKATENWKYDQRREVDEASAKYVNQLMESNALFTDPYIEDYLTQVLHTIVGSQPIIGRPGIPHIRILKNSEPNAFALNNGAIFITTGMLALIKSENELKGALAHEVAHIILDHNLESYNSAMSHESLAQFMGVVGSIAGGAVAANNVSRGFSREYYRTYFRNSVIGGSFLFYALSKSVMDIVGAAYSQRQEETADRLAKKYLNFAGIDPAEYGDLLFRIGERNRDRGLSLAASSMFDHPTIISRLESLEYPKNRVVSKSDSLYDRNIVDILTYNASLEIYDDQYFDAIESLERAIASGWAVDDAYWLKAISLRHISVDRKTTLEALDLLGQASKINALDLRLIDSEKGLLYLRLGDKPNALKAFQNYLSRLSKFDQKEVQDETVWARKMIAKCSISITH